jgi:peptidoglycan hydrolase FlgJ
MAALPPSLPAADLARPAPADLSARVAGAQTREQARLLAQEFERMFLAQMMQPMFAGLDASGPFGGGMAEDVFRPMLLDQYASSLSAGGGVGVADAVYREILKLQGLE